MNILLTGASGFTGRHFMQAATRAGHTVVPLQADLSNPAQIEAEVVQAQPDAVVHLAAISYVAHADASALYAINTVGTTHLLAAVAALRKVPQCVLLASSANVYGNCNSSPIAETQAPVPVNHYAMSKLAMEHMARTYADRLPLIIARPFNYTGPGQASQFLIPKLVQHYAGLADSIELGNIHVEREFNDVRMVCEAYLALLQHGETGQTYNICTGLPYTLQQVMDVLTDITGHRLNVRVNPALVRAAEVHRLCGDPGKLQAATGLDLHRYGLTATLQTMLEKAHVQPPH